MKKSPPETDRPGKVNVKDKISPRGFRQEKPVKITIVGAGNIGSVLGVTLTEAGQDVTLVELRRDLIEAVQKEGLRIDLSDGRTKNVRVKITHDAASAGISDLLIICTKGFSTRAALEGALPAAGQDTWFLSVQNGAGNIETMAEVLKSDSHVIGGVFYNIVTPLALNHLSWVVGLGGLKIGPMNGTPNPMLEKIRQAFKGTDIDVVVTPGIQAAIWNKVLLNLNAAVATALNITNDEFLYYPSAVKMIRALVDELVRVAGAKGLALDYPDDPMRATLEAMQKFRDSGRKPKCSMYQDMENGRKTEIDSIHGSVVREGKKYNIPTPANEFMVNMVHALEEKAARNKAGVLKT
jgi:2-dehydropantoate 2-reductase